MKVKILGTFLNNELGCQPGDVLDDIPEDMAIRMFKTGMAQPFRRGEPPGQPYVPVAYP